ncbi:Protein of unknown function [Nocardia amikacinitolerans]|uniref:DUF2613 domain-containing protein n=1 Tax=Nocardia amikacinitolerans TaxID=756689 RepID=A0A285LY58_9NOCA|nr:DUF2613 domain-containing protein [Nocardia amikacinitolerans]MCP2274589.1 Protein of unknown function (DUF2613) [Nocardia amikacinitolerans]MCP2297065.1 Protein of unknown function (DUF2613) [Nocardia amikacinitolerans]MCP2317245.1 Protein of unknown function (DUF2613) [Nocardia amikacinitolerans]SNY88261.1 Protein of unknown function [Nocardia amikacinitolerans]
MKFAVPGLVSGLAGATLGVVAVLGITVGAQQNSIPAPETIVDPGSSPANMPYGSR